jgi:hypothetical protein
VLLVLKHLHNVCHSVDRLVLFLLVDSPDDFLLADVRKRVCREAAIFSAVQFVLLISYLIIKFALKSFKLTLLAGILKLVPLLLQHHQAFQIDALGLRW